MTKYAALLSLTVTMALSAGATQAMVAAEAEQGFATQNLNVRSRPGTSNGVVGVLPRGDIIDIIGCQNGWCQISHPRAQGFVSQRYVGTGENPVHRGPQIAEPGVIPPQEPGTYANERSYGNDALMSAETAAFQRMHAERGYTDAEIGRDAQGCALYTGRGPTNIIISEQLLDEDNLPICSN